MGEGTILGDEVFFCAGSLWEREPVTNLEQLKARDKDKELSTQMQICEEQDEITDMIIRVCRTFRLLHRMGCVKSTYGLILWVV